MTFPNTSPDTKDKLPSSINTDNMKLISQGLLQTLQKQLANILNPTEEVKVVAPLTNLVSERHFGHLDASQKRRPHSSLHHHSSIILLKQTRQKLRVWYHSLTAAEQSQLCCPTMEDQRISIFGGFRVIVSINIFVHALSPDKARRAYLQCFYVFLLCQINVSNTFPYEQ